MNCFSFSFCFQHLTNTEVAIGNLINLSPERVVTRPLEMTRQVILHQTTLQSGTVVMACPSGLMMMTWTVWSHTILTR